MNLGCLILQFWFWAGLSLPALRFNACKKAGLPCSVPVGKSRNGKQPLCMYTHIHLHEHKQTCIRVDTHIRRNTHTHTHAYIHTYIHTYVRTYIHTYIHMHRHSYMMPGRSTPPPAPPPHGIPPPCGVASVVLLGLLVSWLRCLPRCGGASGVRRL